MKGIPEVRAHPRVDTSTMGIDGSTAQRLTIYTGMILFGQMPTVLGMTFDLGTAVGAQAWYQGPVWVPDSHSYRRDRLSGCVAGLQLGLLVSGAETPNGLTGQVYFADDPRGTDATWLQIVLDAKLRVGMAVSYQVTALAPSDAIVAASS